LTIIAQYEAITTAFESIGQDVKAENSESGTYQYNLRKHILDSERSDECIDFRMMIYLNFFCLLATAKSRTL